MDADDLLLPDGSEVAARLSGTGSGVSDDDLDVAGGDGVAGVGGGGASGGGDGDGELSIAVGDHVIPIIGRSADPLNKDDWDEDFDLDFVGEDEDAETVERSASVVSKASGTSAGEPASALSRFAEGNDDDDDDWGMGSDEEDLGASFGGGDGDGGADVEQIKLRLAALAADDEDENDDFDGMGMDEGHGDLVAKLQNRAMPEEDPFAGMDSDDDDDAAVGEGGEGGGGGGGWGDDDSDSEGCWDDELDLDVGDQQHQQLRDFFNANDEDGDDDADGPGSIIPARFRLLKQLATSSERKVTIVMYPIPTRLWTIKTEAGVPYLQERELESWLDTLVSKRKAVFNDFENVAAWRGDEFKEFRLLPALTIDENGNVVPRDCKFVLRGCLLRMRKLYRQRRPKFRENIRVILAAVAEFLDSELYERKMHANDPDSPSNGGASDDQPAAAASCDVPTFRMVYDIIYAGALVWSQDSAQLFDHAMNVARQFFPRFATMLDLLQIQAVAHHDGSQANDSIRQLCTIYHRFAPPSGVTVPPLLENEEDDDGLLGANDSGMALLSPQSAAKNSMATFTSLLNSNIPVLLSESVCAKAAAQSEAAERLSSADGADEGLVQAGDELELAARDEEKMAQLVCVETLISLHLYLNSNSPLTTAALSTDARWDLDDDGFEWLENAWYGDVPPPTQQSELENLTWRLCGSPELRMTLLEALYKTLDATTRLKALAAYILGRYVYDQHQHQSLAVSKESTKRAETMLFECLYLLDSIQPAVPNNVPMITDLGINALVLYGDILMNNNKFRYGILAFENALHAYKFLKQVPYHQLIRKLSSLCVEHEDFKRAIKYHEQVREKSTEDGNLNMYVYIVQQMSKIHVHRGSFRRAEEAIRNALGYLNRLSAARTQAQATASPGGSRYAPRLDHLHVVGRRDAVLNNWKFSSTPTADFTTAIQTLYVVLAQLYLSGDRIINAINVLEMLRRRHDLPRSKVSLVHLLLATAYVKKRQFAKAGELLTRMEQSATVSASSAGDHRRDRTRTKSFTTGPTPAANLSLGDVVHSAEFMEIRAKNHMYSGEYELAMYWMNKALHDCPPSSLTYLARFHYRRGKVQQAMLLAEMMNTPSIDVHSEIRSGSFGSFTSDSDGEAHYSLNNDAEAPMPHLPDPTACIDSFTKAFEYFRKVDDNVRMAKALNRITDTYLHMVFVSVAVLCHPPAALMPWFRSVGLLERLEIDPDTSPDAAFQEFLAQIDGPAFHALDISSLTMHPILMIKCYVNMAELRFLQNEYDASWAYWKEAHDTFYTLFMNGNQTVLVNKATPGFSANMKTVLKRMVRLLLCFNPELVNEHLNVLDDYILYEVDLFSDLLASYEDQLEAERSDGQMHGSASVMRRDGRESWKKHLSDAFGAAGSRSHGKRNNRRLSLMSSRYHEDAEIDVLCTALAESVCFGLYEIGRACDQYSLGRYGQPQCAEHNRDTMRKMLRNLAQLRELSGTPASTSLEMPAPGRRSSVLSTTSIPEAEEAEGGPPSRRNSDVGLYNLSPAASPARARTQADTAAMSAVAQTSTSSSLWMLEPDSQRDPLWNNLVYMLPLDTIIFIYAPLTQVKTVRLSTEANPALIEALNMVNGKLGHAASASPQAAAAAVRVASTVLGNAPGLNLSSSRSRSRRDVSRRATDGDAVGSSPATRARGQSVSRGESYRLESLARSRLQRSSSLLSLKMPETDPNLPAQGPALAHQHPAHTHIIPTIEFMQELLADFRAKSEPIVDLLVVNDLCPDDETALEAIARAFNKSFASTSRSASGSSTGSEPNEADQGAQALGHAANGGSTPRAGLLRAVESSSATELARLASSRAPMAVAMHHAAALGVDPALLVNVGDDDPDSGRLSPMMLVSEHANDVRRRAREKSLIFAVTPEPNRHRRNSVGGSAASLVINAAALVAGAHSRSNSLMVSNGSNGSKPGSGSLLTPPGSFSAASSSQSAGDWSRREAAKRYLGPAPLDFTLVREMFSHLDPQNVLLLFSALFGECRIILSASSHSRIKAVANTLLRLMYPFQWQHTFIPVLPRECVGALYDTAPYIVGINSYILDAIPTPPGVVVVHLDKNFVKHSPGTFVSLPTRHKNLLQKAIVAFMSKMLLHQVAKMRVQDAGAEEPAAAAPAAGAARGREGSVSTNFAPTVVHAPKMTGKPVLKNITVRAGERSGHVAPDNAAEQRRQSRQRREQSSSSQSRGAVALQLSPPDGSASNLLGDHESEWSVVAEEFDDESSETEDLNGMPLSVELRQLRREQREALQNLADEFLSVFVNLFYKYRLFWDEHAMPPLDLDAFLDYTRQDARTFMESFARTQCFEAFVRARQFVPAAALGEFVFDASVERTLLEKHRSLLAMREEELSDGLLFARGTRSWNRRFVVLSKGELLIFKGRRSKNSKPKLSLKLSPGEYRVVTPCVEDDPQFFSFELCDSSRPAKLESLHFRATSNKQRRRWTRHLHAHVMSEELERCYHDATQFASARKLGKPSLSPPPSPSLDRTPSRSPPTDSNSPGKYDTMIVTKAAKNADSDASSS